MRRGRQPAGRSGSGGLLRRLARRLLGDAPARPVRSRTGLSSSPDFDLVESDRLGAGVDEDSSSRTWIRRLGLRLGLRAFDGPECGCRSCRSRSPSARSRRGRRPSGPAAAARVALQRLVAEGLVHLEVAHRTWCRSTRTWASGSTSSSFAGAVLGAAAGTRSVRVPHRTRPLARGPAARPLRASSIAVRCADRAADAQRLALLPDSRRTSSGRSRARRLVARAGGHDVSPRARATPARRTWPGSWAGRPALVVLAADFAKGALASGVGLAVAGRGGAFALGIAAVLGHMFPVTRRFKGGKGVATAGGMLVVLYPVIVVGPRGRLVPRGPGPQARVGRVAASCAVLFPVAGRGRRLRRRGGRGDRACSRSSSSPATRPTSAGWSRAASCGPARRRPARAAGMSAAVNPGRLRVENYAGPVA